MLGRAAQARLRGDERGWTLLEMLAVVVIIGVLLAVAVPSYLHVREASQTVVAKANVRSALPSIEGYFADYGDYAFDRRSDGSPAASVSDALLSYDGGLPFSGVAAITVVSVGSGGAGYCVSAKADDGEFWKKVGPGGSISVAAAGC